MALDALDLARWQFGVTTVYHFILVPLTIGLAPLVAIMQTLWLRTGKEHWLKATKFFGKLFLINFALGVATGIVQEFQFGMNWSEYAKHVGDIFGAPLAVEALAAFFLESTFLGLWIFGWEKLPKWLHTLTIWMVAIGVNLSAYWILAANSWMQNPVGAVYNPATGRAELDGVGGFFQMFTSETTVLRFFHTVSTSFLVAGTFVAALSVWWIVREVRAKREDAAKKIWRPVALFGAVVVLLSAAAVTLSGDLQGKHMYKIQPMKMAAAEAACYGEEGTDFAVFATGLTTGNCEDVKAHITVPNLTSFLATNKFTGPESYLPGVKDVEKKYKEDFGPIHGDDVNYVPNLFVTFWTFRLMIGTLVFSGLLALGVFWFMRKGRVTDNKWLSRLALISIPMPFIGASFGWIFTEMGRQPWIVAPGSNDPLSGIAMLTRDGLSTSVSMGSVAASLIIFTLLYLGLGVVWAYLLRRYAREGVTDLLPSTHVKEKDAEAGDLSFGY
ncbi:cytochrome ubiquinol oxidase subunit I [Buchananella felis]|uniref:cytochrome ubiquinol oxidase subunit I n=1 Tax=Buchananella felis TaxID=3231492 RepID=UPI00352808E8